MTKIGDLLGSPLVWVVVALGVIAAIRLLSGGLLSSVPRVAFKELPSGAEVRFLLILIEALPGYIICPQVAMGGLLKVDSGVENKRFWATRNKFSQKIVDYAVIDPSSGKVVVLIELDDRSHDAARDRDRDAMLARAGYNFDRFVTRPFPNIAIVREQLAFDPRTDRATGVVDRREHAG